VPLPSCEEQHEIVRRVEALFAYADRVEARYTAARAQVERLTPALLAKAFRGELVPQDPNDEPASVLLERIHASRAAAGEKPPRKVRTERKPMATTLTTDTLKEIIRGLPTDQFTFDDLRGQVSADYETLKDVVFALLSEAPASIKQVFDTEAKTMRLARVK
jgi:type I restriction enzyme S subunit